MTVTSRSRKPSAGELAEQIRSGLAGAVARGISICETGGERADALLEALPPRRCHVIGVTGAPGAGKSTLVGSLVPALRSAGQAVGVVAVDPTSPMTGGALLADRVRLQSAVGDDGVFFRSLASRGAAGGLSDATRAATTVLSAAGFEQVVVETVGAGQSEVEIMRVADSVLVVLNPGAGDDLQALKAGIMEIGDIFVLNKSDLPGAADLKSHLIAALRTREGADWYPRFVQTVANTGDGIPDLLDLLERHRSHLGQGDGQLRQRSGMRAEVMRAARAAFHKAAARHIDEILAAADAQGLNEVQAARMLARSAAEDLTTGRTRATEIGG